MKSYRNAIAALILAFVFSTSTFAGDGVLHTDKTPPPPPPPLAEGTIYTNGANPAPEEDALTEIMLSLLQTLIPLL
jgi:hypothetical protein